MFQMSLQNKNNIPLRVMSKWSLAMKYKRIFPGANQDTSLCSNLSGMSKGMLPFKFKMFI